jgi:hypothetical protein
VTVNLAPASSRRSGSEFDLAIACCVVAADGLIDAARLARVGLFGELGLGGLLRPCAGASAAAAAAGEARLAQLIVALPDLDEARSARALPVAGRLDLSEVVALLATPGRERTARPIDPEPRAAARPAGGRGMAGTAAHQVAAERRADLARPVDGTLVRSAAGPAPVEAVRLRGARDPSAGDARPAAGRGGGAPTPDGRAPAESASSPGAGGLGAGPRPAAGDGIGRPRGRAVLGRERPP